MHCQKQVLLLSADPECQPVWIRILGGVFVIVLSDHTYSRGKGCCLCDCRPVCSENRICELTDYEGSEVVACEQTESLCCITWSFWRVGQDGEAAET